MSTAFDFSIQSLEGGELPVATWRGKVLLVVNVASRCGFTPQYEGLERLWQDYAARGLVVVGFPCDQFGHQEPGDPAQIREFCSLRYGVTFPMAGKIEVNGANAHPLWRWLQRERRGALGIASIKWNFTKFLIGRDGKVLRRFGPMTRPEQLAQAIDAALDAP